MPRLNSLSIQLGFVLFTGLVLTGCGGGGSSSATPVTIPVAFDDVLNVTENSSMTGSVASNDIRSDDGGNVWLLVTDVANGELSFEDDGDFVYTPNEDFTGSDSFAYFIKDADEDSSDIATVTISVNSKDIVADPFIIHQWYLENTGQNALTTSGSGGTAGADVNLSGAGSSAYAQGLTGAGVQIAVIDNDLQIAHEDLQPNILADASYNFFTENGKDLHDPTAPNTVDNPSGYHGTSVAGLAAARGGNGIGIWGVAPQVSLVGYNLLYDGFFLTDELAALGYASSANNYPELGSQAVDIFNMSYGRNPFEYTDADEVQDREVYTPEILAGLKWGTQNLRDGKGAIYVKAGGNDYEGGTAFTDVWCSQAASNDITCYNVNMESENVTPYQMIIGAFNADNKRSSYSSTGSALWLVAPGGEFGVDDPALITTDFTGCTYGFSRSTAQSAPFNSAFNTGADGTDNENCNYVSAFNGTSSATPIVSGIAALLLEANPNLTWREVKHILATTARQLDAGLADNEKTFGSYAVTLEHGWTENDAGYHFSNHYGFGAPDADAAITMALNWKANTITLPPMKEVQLATELVGLGVPDFSTTGLSLLSSVNVSESWITESVEIVVTIDDLASAATNSENNNIDMSDYQIVLRSPKGTESVLLTPFNAYESGHDMDELKLISHAFYGEASNGDWSLIVRDLDNSTDNRISNEGEGRLVDWSLKIYGR